MLLNSGVGRRVPDLFEGFESFNGSWGSGTGDSGLVLTSVGTVLHLAVPYQGSKGVRLVLDESVNDTVCSVTLESPSLNQGTLEFYCRSSDTSDLSSVSVIADGATDNVALPVSGWEKRSVYIGGGVDLYLRIQGIISDTPGAFCTIDIDSLSYFED